MIKVLFTVFISIFIYSINSTANADTFDDYMQGSKKALSPKEKRGYQLFKSYGCANCHNASHKSAKNQLNSVCVTNFYFHNGSVKTLNEAIVLMGKKQLGIKIPEKDVNDIVYYLNSLINSAKK